MVKLKLGQAVYIVWMDAQSTTSKVWHSREEAQEMLLYPIYALGFVLADKPDRIVLAGHVGGESAAGIMVIPRGSIAKLIKLKGVRCE